ncbi:LytR family transcriptional regulator [Clostridiaceae bacterium DONG20-135]|uniref:LytR family transcriptional regulator n=1 Tax=Copranaerobaculum intestinale TaxID=2692629 RepID=A0A6N8U8D6_9FIRM|nr:LCP family protein [Copranaerobaculum intestinale]MXQ72973.1 LytR family transcriptional regulator [Copranaerobaculum intestinale]
MSKKAKKRLIIILSVIIVLLVGGIAGANLYVDSILNKMDQKEEFSKKDVKANTLDDDTENIALLGIDKSDGNGTRSDVIKIISLNFNEKKIKITSVQRDNLVFLPLKGRYEKLNHAYAYNGVKGSLAALNYNFDMNITKYVKFSFDSVEKIVDILGGVDINLTSSEASYMNLGSAGVYHMNGSQTLAYSRIRKIDSDYERMQRQNNVINAIVGSIKGESPLKLLDFINKILPFVETNVSNGTIKNYATKLLSFDLSDIQQYQFPSGGYDSILKSLYLYGFGPHYVLKDFTGEVELMHKNIYGKDYTASDNVKKVDRETKEMAGNS